MDKVKIMKWSLAGSALTAVIIVGAYQVTCSGVPAVRDEVVPATVDGSGSGEAAPEGTGSGAVAVEPAVEAPAPEAPPATPVVEEGSAAPVVAPGSGDGTAL